MTRPEPSRSRLGTLVGGPLLGPWLDSVAPEPAPGPSLLRFSRRAMATTFELLLPFGSPADLANCVFDLIEELESQLTVYCDDSEVALLNQNAAASPIPVERRLFDLLTLCARLT